MALPVWQLPPIPLVSDDPQVLMHLWFHYTATPKQRTAAIAATTPKPDKEQEHDESRSE